MERVSRAAARPFRRATADQSSIEPAPPRAGVEPVRAGLPTWLHVLALAAAFVAGILAFPLVSRAVPATGVVAPDFVLKDVRGGNQRLSEFRGDIVVLSFWTSSCGECRETLESLRGLGAGAAAEAPVVISVNIDGDPARGASVARSLDTGYATLLDAHQAVARLYDISHLPLTLLIDREGVVRGAWAREKISTDELLAGIRELQRK